MTALMKLTQTFRGPRKEQQPLRVVQVTAIDHDRAIAIQNHGSLAQL
jgi:hypothetical protein